jgi:hypothetical protein
MVYFVRGRGLLYKKFAIADRITRIKTKIRCDFAIKSIKLI